MSGQSDQESPPPLPGKSRSAAVSARNDTHTTSLKRPGRLRRWFWAPVRHDENWAQTVFRVLGNLFRLALTAFVLFIVLVGAIVGFYAAKEERPEWFGSSHLTEWCDDQYDNEYYKHARSEKVCSVRWAELDAAREAELASKPENFVLVTIEPSILEPGVKKFADGCSEDYPFAILVRNNSDMAMTETWIDVSVREKGTTKVSKFRGRGFRGQLSENWVDAEDTQRVWIERIIMPNSTDGYCRKFAPENFLNFDPEAFHVFKVELNENTKFAEPENWMYEELGVTRGD